MVQHKIEFIGIIEEVSEFIGIIEEVDLGIRIGNGSH